MDQTLRMRSLVLLIAILPGLLDVEPLAPRVGSVDDAALLMLASQAMLLGPEAFAEGSPARIG